MVPYAVAGLPSGNERFDELGKNCYVTMIMSIDYIDKIKQIVNFLFTFNGIYPNTATERHWVCTFTAKSCSLILGHTENPFKRIKCKIQQKEKYMMPTSKTCIISLMLTMTFMPRMKNVFNYQKTTGTTNLSLFSIF